MKLDLVRLNFKVFPSFFITKNIHNKILEVPFLNLEADLELSSVE